VTTETVSTADDEDPPPKKPPKFCPWCGAEVAKRWVPSKIRSLHDRIGARVAYVCFACKIGVRAFAFPSRPLSTTKKAARTEAQRDYDELEASGFSDKYSREQYAKGKCSCSRPYRQPYGVSVPCPIHNPLREKRA